LELLETTGRAVIQREHEFFISYALDNGEHIPRIGRIAESVAGVLKASGHPEEEASALRDRLVGFGKELFLDEWMPSLEDDEDPDAVLEYASRVFDHILAGGDPRAI